MEHSPLGAWRIEALLAGVELNFILKAGQGPIRMDDQGRKAKFVAQEALRAEHHGDLRLRGGCGNHGPRVFKEVAIGRRHLLRRPSIAGNEALGEADQAGMLQGCFGDGLAGELDRLVGSGGVGEVGERDSESCHTHFDSKPLTESRGRVTSGLDD